MKYKVWLSANAWWCDHFNRHQGYLGVDGKFHDSSYQDDFCRLPPEQWKKKFFNSKRHCVQVLKRIDPKAIIEYMEY